MHASHRRWKIRKETSSPDSAKPLQLTKNSTAVDPTPSGSNL
jgi:hypothetical protein